MSSWDTILPAAFCEGKEYPFLVPHFYEFFSAFSGLVLTVIAIVGLLQPRIEVILKLMYGGIFVSGIGTFLLHFNRIAAYNLADVFPLLITLTLGLIAFFDEVIFEFRRPKEAHPCDFLLEEKDDRIRAALDLLFYVIWLAYLTIGLILIVYPPIKEIFSIYFGIPYAVVAIGGMLYLFFSQRNVCRIYHGTDALPKYKRCNQNLKVLMIVAICTAVVSIIFKVLDSSACSRVLVWFFPHPLFHILLTYSTHCVIIFLGFYRSNNLLYPQQASTEVKWVLKFFPLLYIPVRRTTSILDMAERPSIDVPLFLNQV